VSSLGVPGVYPTGAEGGTPGCSGVIRGTRRVPRGTLGVLGCNVTRYYEYVRGTQSGTQRVRRGVLKGYAWGTSGVLTGYYGVLRRSPGALEGYSAVGQGYSRDNQGIPQGVRRHARLVGGVLAVYSRESLGVTIGVLVVNSRDTAVTHEALQRLSTVTQTALKRYLGDLSGTR
jgi:hypothetical protein